jgi:hypothetical protein
MKGGETEGYIRTPGRLYRKRIQKSVDVPDKSEMFEIRWDHVRSKLKGGVIFLKLAHKPGTVLSVVEILSHKRPFDLFETSMLGTFCIHSKLLKSVYDL